MTLLSFLLLFPLFILHSVHCGAFISSNPVILYSNGTISKWNTAYIKAEEFKSIITFDNLVQPPSAGLEGILYDRGYSCSIHNTSPLKTEKINRIALVKYGGDCDFYQKVYNSQLDGADGVIIYNEIPFEKNPNSGIEKIEKGNITITMYYVDSIDLAQMLHYVSNQPITTLSNNVSYQPAIRVILHPDEYKFPTDWVYILIIVIALLAVSFLASVGMHWHLWRIRRRQRALYESGVIDMGAVLNTHPQSIKKVIDPASLSLFPTRIIDAHNQEEIPTSNSNQEGDLENNDQQLHHESHEQVCVICLDEFSAGEQVRKLPCSHEFHTECIDPWLTIKSASCPLCKHDCYVKTETNDTEQSTSQPTPLLQPPRSSSPFFASLRPSSRSPSPAFGPTIPADRAEEFSRSWMARSLPRNMRRQIHEAAQAAAAAHQETVIELPARMTQPVEDLTIPVPPPPTAAASMNNRTRLTNRFKDSLPRFLRSV